jgi:LPS-assembly lipoprotein
VARLLRCHGPAEGRWPVGAQRPCIGRRTLVGSVALAGIGLLAGCGFRLREPPRFAFRRIAFSGFERESSLAVALRRALEASGQVRVVAGLAEAEIVLDVIDAGRDKGVVAVTAAGQVREFVLRERLRFRVVRADGKPLIEPTLIEQRRELTYTESTALAKEREEAQLVRAMHADIVDQVLRRLALVEPV